MKTAAADDDVKKQHEREEVADTDTVEDNGEDDWDNDTEDDLNSAHDCPQLLLIETDKNVFRQLLMSVTSNTVSSLIVILIKIKKVSSNFKGLSESPMILTLDGVTRQY